jgi:hypothetical protein
MYLAKLHCPKVYESLVKYFWNKTFYGFYERKWFFYWIFI